MPSELINNAEKYHFEDFTRTNYRKLLNLAKKNYQAKLFTDDSIIENFVLWRHDVDCYPPSSLKLAQIEYEENIKATYFLLFHSEYYNLLDADNIECIKQIIGMGHEIGLHFDCSFYKINNEPELEKYLKIEKDLFNLIFNFDVKVFSFHNPFEFELSCRNLTYAGLINTYSEKFHSSIGYCSDSNGYWRYERLEDVILSHKYKSLQILTHPEQWPDEIMSPKQRVHRCISEQSDSLKKKYNDFLITHDRKNIDW
jgi:hypothetical protein